VFFMKRIFIVIVCGITVFTLKAQSPNENLKKYWFYRYRLINDFMKIGANRGESIPAGLRRIKGNINDPSEQDLKWGDSTIKLGQYIGVLATEYKLLKDNGRNTFQTRKELYFALEAFNRLDETAESYFRCVTCLPNPQPGDLNGYFIKDDVTMDDPGIGTTDFVEDTLDHFNSNSNSRVEVTDVNESGFDFVHNEDNRRPPSSESHDQVWVRQAGNASEIRFGCLI